MQLAFKSQRDKSLYSAHSIAYLFPSSSCWAVSRLLLPLLILLPSPTLLPPDFLTDNDPEQSAAKLLLTPIPLHIPFFLPAKLDLLHEPFQHDYCTMVHLPCEIPILSFVAVEFGADHLLQTGPDRIRCTKAPT